MMTPLPLSPAQLSNEMFAAQRRLSEHQTAPCGTRTAPSGMTARLARFIGRLGNQLNKPPRIVLLGEFNSGKSTLANALLGAEVLPTSVHVNTRVPLLIHYSDSVSLTYEDHERVRHPLSMSAIEELTQGAARMLRVGLPLARLKSFELIDTPGLATGCSQVDDLKLEACRRSHIAVWCTVATQAWKASEQSIWRAMPCRLRQRGILAVTHRDAVRSDHDAKRLMSRLDAEAGAQFNQIVMVAASDALAAAQLASTSPDSVDATAQWATSGGRELEHRLRNIIDSEMTSRRGSAERLLERTSQRLLQPGLVPAS